MINKTLAKQINEMYKVDQDLRGQAKRGRGPINFLIYAIDWVHNYRIKKIIELYGYPNLKLIGKGGLHNFWLLIQHQDFDIELQKACLKRCCFSKKDEAFLTDRILIKREGRQLYGTQFRRVGQKLELFPIKDKKMINSRRKKVGLNPLEKYSQKINNKLEKGLKRKNSQNNKF